MSKDNFSPDTIILAGGKGTRLANEVPGILKILAPVGGKPFADHMIEYLSSTGIRRIVISLGHLAEQVVNYIQTNKFKNIDFDYVIENQPLGTGGGIRKAFDNTSTDPILVLNGDTYCEFSLTKFVDFHQQKKAKISILSSLVTDSSRFGTLEINIDDEVVGFREKNHGELSASVNAGVYLISRDIFSKVEKDKSFSFEKEFLPNLCGNGLYAYAGGNYFIDMGTPESYRQANEFFSQTMRKTL